MLHLVDEPAPVAGPQSLYAPVPFEARRLGYMLGLGDIQLREPCSGYEHLCVCSRCLAGDENLALLGRLRQDRQEIARLREDFEMLDLNAERAAERAA